MIALHRELVDAAPTVAVDEAEYRRLLGYPRGYEPGERARELAAWARGWYAKHGRPWIHLREAELQLSAEVLRLDGREFRSPQLHEHLVRAGAQRAVFAAVSAGAECEEQARALWQDARPDEYFFLEIFGSAVVEHLVASLHGRLCDFAERDGFVAIPHYSPGYSGWDVADQPRLFELITHGGAQSLPGPLAILPSGMLRPKKSLLAVIGLVPRADPAVAAAPLVPCPNCSFSPCRYRRAPYRPARGAAGRDPVPASLPGGVRYTVSPRALEKWARERVSLAQSADGSTEARFRFDGTTCSNLGQPLAFDYIVSLGPPADGHPILAAGCRPSPGEEGYQSMCAYLSDADALMAAIAAERPPPGRPLHEAWAGAPAMMPSGCHCTAGDRAHKWNLALQAIHYVLEQRMTAPAPDSSSP